MKINFLVFIATMLLISGCSSNLKLMSPRDRSSVNLCFNKVLNKISKIGLSGSLSRIEEDPNSKNIYVDRYVRSSKNIAKHMKEFTFLHSPQCRVSRGYVDLNPKTESQLKYNILYYMKEQKDARALGVSAMPVEFQKMTLLNTYHQSSNLLGENNRTTKSIKLISLFFSKGFVDK